METAIVCAKRGHKVTLYEKSSQLGGVFVAAAAPSFKEKDRQLLAWYQREIQKYPIQVHLNAEIHDLASLKADEIVIATGAKAKKLPIPGAEHGIEAVDFLLKKKSVGQNVVIIGGGLTGCEIAYELYLQKKTPIIVEMQDDLICGAGICLANSSYLRDFFAANQVNVHLNTQVQKIEKDGVLVKDQQNNTFKISADSVIVSVGYTSAPLANKGLHIHIVGDAKKVGNLRTVIWEAWNIAMKL